MLKTIAAIRRRAGMSNAAFRRYYHDVHGALAAREPLGVQLYVQNHVVDGVYGTHTDAAVLTGTPRDGVTELSFADPAAMAHTFAHPYVRDILGPDGAKFSDMPTAISLVVRIEGEAPPIVAGRKKALWFLKAADGADPEAFDEAWRSADAASVGAVATLRNHRIRFPAGQDPADYFGGPDSLRYDGVHSVWWDADDALAAMEAYVDAVAQVFGDRLDRSRSFWVLAQEVEIFRAG